MTAQLSRVVYCIGNPENDDHFFTNKKGNADIAKQNGYEVSEYILAGMDSEPVGYFGRFYPDDEYLIDQCSPNTKGAFPLYAAPPAPAPVAVPDEWPEKLTWSHHDDMTQAEVLAWNNAIDACRAAMQAEPVSAAYKLPDGWIKCVERMPKKGDRVLIFIDFNSQAVPPSVHDAEYTGATFRRGNATVKIYPHEDGFGVTHWMPLPAAPQQE